jgi:2-polyprenyl-3-methyl-5-hydroxy-6-metoxy-1,4-benzoquinol methylase/predicted RNA-binding Zn-ribbon protein involved in translation (DUF1610 family)
MSSVNIKKCPVCGDEKIEFNFTCKDNFASGEDFNIYYCRQCGFTFTNGFPSSDDIDKYYDNPEYISHSDTKKGLENKLYHFVRRYMLKSKLRLVCRQSKKSKGKLLDLVCGTGYFLKMAKRKGWETVGIERDARARQSAIENFYLNVKAEAYLHTLPVYNFDVITLWHVLEHLENLNGSMQRIYDLLADDGIVVIALPNCNSYDARHYKNDWAAYDVPRHLWHFTPKTFKILAEKHDFKIVRKKRMPMDSFYISLLTEKYRHSNTFIKYFKAISIGTIGAIKSLFSKSQSSSVIYVLKKIEN